MRLDEAQINKISTFQLSVFFADFFGVLLCNLNLLI